MYIEFLRNVWRRNLVAFGSLGIVGIILRATRMKLIDVPDAFLAFANTDIAVAIEHFCAGIGCPAGIAASLFFVLWLSEKCSRKPGKEFSLGIDSFIFSAILAVAALSYSFHMWQHEVTQAFEHVYKGGPRGAVQYWQLLVGTTSIGIFFVTNIIYWSTRGITRRST
jgi:hypothetical protein